MDLIIIPIIICVIAQWMPHTITQLEKVKCLLEEYFLNRRLNKIFDQRYIDIDELYFQTYRQVPCKNFIDNVDARKISDLISAGYAGKLIKVYERNIFSPKENKLVPHTWVFKLSNRLMIELGYNYAEVLVGPGNTRKANDLVTEFSLQKMKTRNQEFEINIITRDSEGLSLKQLEIKPTTLDIGLYYNDSFAPVDALIKERLGRKNDKGIVLLHGIPGTGKTTYLRHLIGSIEKRILFVSPSVACNLANPEFIDILVDNPESVLIIEDAENIIMDRKYNSDSSVSNLLNLSDGLMSDFLNVQIVCTFNSELNKVDSALLRKGRLIAAYEFGNLSIEKAQRLSDHFGHNEIITRPMTIAEIANPAEKETAKRQMHVMGFRREELVH